MKSKKTKAIDETLVLLSPKETARRLSISLDALRWQVDSGKFPAPRRIGGLMRFLASDLGTYAQGLPLAEIGYRGFPDEDARPEPTAPLGPPEKIAEHEGRRRIFDEQAREYSAQLAAQDREQDSRTLARKTRDPKAPLPLP